MEIRLDKTELITNAEVKEFTIADDGISKAVIMSILTTSKYTDPVGAAIRESIANALDAHREAGCADRRIEITLPTASEKYIRIRDYGTGMSRETIDNVYTNLGVSTKRSSNDLQGGFGIGAAAILAPSSQAQLVTIYKGVRYTYILFRNEQKIPAIALTGTVAAPEEESGTEVIIPMSVRNEVVEDKLLEICLYLEPAPHFVNSPYLETRLQANKNKVAPIYVRTSEIQLPGEEYATKFEWRYTSQTPSSSTTLTVLNDFVSYKWNSVVGHREGLSFSSGSSNVLVLKFPVGELDLPSDRERLQETDRNKQLIQLAADRATSDLRAIVTEKIANQTSFVEALRAAAQSPWSHFSWQGKNYSTDYISLWERENRTPVIFDKTTGWRFRVGQDIYALDEHKRVKRVLGTDAGTKVLSFNDSAKVTNLIDYPIYLVETGMISNTFMKRAGLTEEDSFIFLQSNDPNGWLETNPVFQLLGAKVVLAPEKKEKARSETTDPRKVFRSLAKGEGAVRKFNRTPGYPRTVWDCIVNVSEIPESGYYLDSDQAKSLSSLRLLLVRDILDRTYVFQPRVAEVVKQINRETEGEKLWVSALDEVKRRTLALANSYKDVFQRLGTDLRSQLFAESADRYKLNAVLEIPSLASILDSDGRLRELLAIADLALYQTSWQDNNLELDWCPRRDENHKQTEYPTLEQILEPIYQKYPLLRWSQYYLGSNDDYFYATQQYVNLIDSK